MIHEGGLDALSMRALAQRVGVSVTTLYNLFDTREAIVRAALDQVLAELVPLVSSLKPTTDLGQLCDNSASIIDAYGPAAAWVTSMMRTPTSGPPGRPGWLRIAAT